MQLLGEIGPKLIEQATCTVLVAPFLDVLPIKVVALNCENIANVLYILASLTKLRPAQLGDHDIFG